MSTMLDATALTGPARGLQPLSDSQRDAKLMDAAKELEANFLAEMLKAAGLNETPDGFGGGEGEEQFTSFLRLEQARQMVDAGGIGLAQSLFEAMKEHVDGAV